jgi:isoleucyl-tRNA synthetase
VAEHVAALVEQHGADVWFERPVSELLPPLFQREHCGGRFSQGEDILDVWFDSA